ncbi:S26 family signal peptidase [Alteromonas sp. AMM-1]|uniref:S26 family signal peptidase n=1 Tax=Alteromonas sp. AMM-1 TaxID=3394233 RepID=UPI0039A5D7B4
MLSILRVQGRSMLPTLPPDSYVLVAKLPFQTISLNDMVVVNTAQYGVIVKRVMAVNGNRTLFYLCGDNIAESISTNQIGPVCKADIAGKVIWSKKPPQSACQSFS